jgi:hypothetical protein
MLSTRNPAATLAASSPLTEALENERWGLNVVTGDAPRG